MSSRKAATAKAAAKNGARNGVGHRPAVKPALAKAAAKPAAKPVVAKPAAAKPAAKPPATKPPATKPAGDVAASAEATALAAKIERDLRDGRLDTLSPQAFQALMAALCKSYGTQLEAGADFLPVADRSSVSPTEIMTTTSALLKAANLAVFELGMWQSWTGR
jgi:hypothetical protein